MSDSEVETSDVPDVVVDSEAPVVLNLQRRVRAVLLLCIAGVLLMVWIWMGSSKTSDRLDDLNAKDRAKQVLIDKLATQLDEAINQGAEVPTPEVVAADVPGAEVSPVVTAAPGSPGERGDAGPAGAAGAPGDVGSAGSAGSPGSKGDTGATGQTGSSGATGDAGANGSNGATGATGIKGDTGAKGDKGDQGDRGDPGAKGDTGSTGAKGDKGDPGQYPSVQHYNFPQGPYTCIETGAGTGVFNCNPD